MTPVQNSSASRVAWGTKDPSELLGLKVFHQSQPWHAWVATILYGVIPLKYETSEKKTPTFLNEMKTCLGIEPQLYIKPQHKSVLHAKAPNATSLITVLSEKDYREMVNQLDEFQFTPLHIAAYYKNFLFASELLFFGAKPNSNDLFGSIPLHIAATMGCQRTAKCLLEWGASLTMADKSGNFPVHVACSFGHTDLAILLIDNMNAEHLNQGNCEQNTPLHLAVENCRNSEKQRIVAKLIEKNVDLNVVNHIGRTPLIHATLRQSEYCLRLLVTAGADKTIKDHVKFSALDWARKHQYHNIIDILRDAGVKQSAQKPPRHCSHDQKAQNLTSVKDTRWNIR